MSVVMIERHYGALLDGAGAGIAGRLDVAGASIARRLAVFCVGRLGRYWATRWRVRA